MDELGRQKFQGADQLLKAAGGEPGELRAMDFEHRLIEAGEQFKAHGRDGDLDGAPVLAGPAAGGEAAPLQAVQQAGDVGFALDHAGGDVAAEQTRVTGAAQDAEHVVLRRRQPVLLQEGGGRVGERVGGAENGDEGFLGGVRACRATPGWPRWPCR
jgi:hypothetical protein